jgi:molybdate transport system substrate-binding protein
MNLWKIAIPILCLLFSNTAHGAVVQVAVAANFTKPMEKISADFEQATGHKVVIAFGTVGKFYSQIQNGAPFEVFVSADEDTPKRLESEGLTVAGSRFTYAIGKLVLFSVKQGFIDGNGEVLKQGDFRHITIANPKVAVYGAAAVEVMNKMEVYSALEHKIVTGENITQAYQFVATGNADLGFVALSQIYKDGEYNSGSHWIVPENLYPQLKQDAILLKKGNANQAAKEFLQYLKSEPAKSVISGYGYSF